MFRIVSGQLGVCVLIAFIGLSPTTAAADYKPTAEQRSACMSDTLRLCASEIPNTMRIIYCLARQKSQMSPRCRRFFDQAGL